MRQGARLQKILNHLEAAPDLTVDDACQLLDASPATVRRDFTLLADTERAKKNLGRP